jgi:hypothetical protein
MTKKQNILSFLANETGATKSYGSSKFCFESIEVSKIDYDDSHQKKWNIRESGETTIIRKSINLLENALELKRYNIPPLFKYFLDGSRRTYKVDDVAYNNKIYPIIAGQIGVGCCQRLKPDNFKGKIIEMQNVIVMPSIADADGYKPDLYFNNLLSKVNKLEKLRKIGVKFKKILRYSSKKENDKYENSAIAKIQNEMIELEKTVVLNLTAKKLLNADTYLIKDGSLEYKLMETGNFRELAKIKNNYRHVIGVSKRFNPEIAGKNNITKLAELPLYHRTPAIKYNTGMVGDINFAIWYIRIRDKKYSASPFEGIIKVEKILVTDSEYEEGLESEEIDNISAHLINERNPVCYGSDNRWANHLYPIYLTERFIKSKYLSDGFYLNLF